MHRDEAEFLALLIVIFAVFIIFGGWVAWIFMG